MASTSRSRAALEIKPVEDRRFLGIGMVLLALMFFTGIDTSAKWLVLSGMPSLQAAFARYSVALVLVVALLAPRYGREVVRSNNVRLELIRALVLMGSTILNFFAVNYLPLTVTGSIIFSMPLILCALSGPLLGEKVGWRRWAAILVGFSGVLIIIRPGGTDFHPAMFLSLGAVTCYALYSVCNRKLAGVDSPFTQQFYAAFVPTICILPFVIPGWVWPNSVDTWIAFFAMGVVGGIGHLLITVAHRYAEASTLAPFTYSQIIYLTASSWLVFDQPPTVWVYVGAPIVIGSGLYIWVRERQLAKQVQVTPPG